MDHPNGDDSIFRTAVTARMRKKRIASDGHEQFVAAFNRI